MILNWLRSLFGENNESHIKQAPYSVFRYAVYKDTGKPSQEELLLNLSWEPGILNSLHSHFSAEIFMILKGKFRMVRMRQFSGLVI